MAGAVLAFSRGAGFSASQFDALILFVPAIAAISGNAGIQTSTIILRGFATGELAASKLRHVFLREVQIAIAVAISCAVLAGGMASIGLMGLRAAEFELATSGDVSPGLVGLAVGLGMFVGIIEAGCLGIALPFIFRRVGVDPAIASGPLITTINDALSLTIYLLIALAILT
jgi:magnesium transporter